MTDDILSPASPAPAEVDFYQPGTHTAEASFGYTMRRIMTLLAQDIERLMEPHGLTNAQWMPLMKLYFGQARTVAELARECAMDAGAMTRLLDRLEAKGLCQRQRSSEDRRVVNLVLTADGLTAAQNIPAELCKAQNACLRGFSADEWQTLMGLLHRVLHNAQNAAAPAPSSSSAPDAPPLTPETTPETTSQESLA